MHTLVIAPTEHAAKSWARWFFLMENIGPPRPSDSDVIQAGYRWRACRTGRILLAWRGLEDTADLRRIVIKDYLDWKFSEPGQMTHLWELIQRHQKRGVEVVWK